MIEAPPFDKSLGMLYYVTDTCPAGGVIKARPEDFIVEEVLKDGTVVALTGISLKPRVGSWTWIHVVKKNTDTLKLLLYLAKTLGLKARDISIGGIKDTRAVTSQIISIRGDVTNLPKIRNVEFLSFWPMDKPITPSLIYGNRFTITLRNVEKVDCAEATLKTLQYIALPNYYGYQRFGTIRPVSHLLGKALVKKDAEEFFDIMFCKIFAYESDVAKKAREAACKGDYRRALEIFPKRFIEERAVLRGLLRGLDLWNAIMSIPIQILRIYVEALQSYLFNLFLSKRMELGPLNRPIEGDLVEINGQVVHYAEGLGGEVVLPTVGVGVKMPRGKVGEAVLQLLKREGVEPSMFLKMPRGLRVYGGYRKVVLTLRDFRYAVDKEVTVSFTLPRGSYATVILREVVKPEEPYRHGF
ncbi:Pseudouridylate synthase [Pyrobaculum islandicum DSM 4184]|uniref:Probable tRNA pseudouridine synthase D n=1 Tax=Pyrobaculum islandicum (strain DSM 4184 / JCM 9189 / GEO3) TaxID=384616 RepID=TRUD_PYRIL|nr:tRNA pseudouridine(13) synthase TruD [Pyrobaculum islandicum]A1RRV7.1 RecName: Full=Probable tRNA pseudouridine synthase D; AltName: Full=tRNA pseudouridine(13) synthase; AltName: Full=tRNA pseudouridylate synthase D; AltName: Full=tRNA-uridine isomerase D [Pyrobaculum islandicum DSM 4184]ABL87689.1 Pseudouridylate synthase [Pyrobaculum islandicum DSM 4184]